MSPMPEGWRVGVRDARVELAAPPSGSAAEYVLTPAEGRAIADKILRALVLSYDGSDISAGVHDAIRWVVAPVGSDIRLRVSPAEPSGVYPLEDFEAFGLASTLMQGSEVAERLGGEGVDDEAGRLIEETLRRIPGYMQQLELDAADPDRAIPLPDWDATNVGTDEQSVPAVERLKDPSPEAMNEYRKFVDQYLSSIADPSGRDEGEWPEKGGSDD